MSQDEEVQQDEEISEIEKMREQIRTQDDKYVRLLAENENHTKRMQE